MNAPISRFTPVLLAGLGQSSPGQASPGQGSSVPASPTPGGPDAAALCATTQLTLRIGGGFVSDGADTYYIYFKNAGPTACTLRGYPGVSAVTGPGNSASQIGSDAKRTATSPVASQLLKPGQSVQATLQFGRAGNYVSPQCQHVNVSFLKIFPPGNTTATYAGSLDERVCAETTLPTMTITTVIPDP
jgi:hypothetical protein